MVAGCDWRCFTTLGFFPTPYSDELFYSLVARYHAQLEFLGQKEIIGAIFSSRTAAAIHDLPCRLETFYRQLSPRTLLTPARLIYQHTLYPFYRPFLPVSRARIIFEWMRREGKGSSIHGTIGAMASGVRVLSCLRFCPDCVEDDRRNFREAYWHRSHQLPGIGLCHKHLVYLRESGVSVSSRQQKYTFVPLETVADKDSQSGYRDLNREIAVYLATATNWLLTHRPSVWGLEELHHRYIELLARRHLVTPLGFIHQSTLLREFSAFFGKDFLGQIGCALAEESEDNWLSNLIRKPRKTTHPLRHLMLMKFLDTSPKEFLGRNFVHCKPFGKPPFPCLNPAAPHYLEAIIPDVSITRNTENGLPIGNFCCACGFAYARTGPDRTEEDRLKRTRIIAMGPLWESRLAEVVTGPKVGLRKAARLLGVDPKTVIRHLQSNQKQMPPKCAPDGGSETEPSRKQARKKLQEMRRRNPAFSRTALRKLLGGDYTWLYRHDREWLNAHLPPCTIKRGTRAPRIDWKKRDQEICGRVKTAIEELRKDSASLRRITKGCVGEMSGCLSLIQKHLGKLPQTREVLEAACESVEDFQLRRVRRVVSMLHEENVSIATWRIVREARLRPNISQKVADEIKRLAKV